MRPSKYKIMSRLAAWTQQATRRIIVITEADDSLFCAIEMKHYYYYYLYTKTAGLQCLHEVGLQGGPKIVQFFGTP